MRVTRLYRYPVKSMGGEEIQSTRVCGNGFLGDRRFAILDVETGVIASAKRPRTWGALLQFSARYLSDPALGKPLPPIEIRFPDGTAHRSDSATIDAELSTAIGREVRLITQSPGTKSSEGMWRVVQGHEATEWTRERTVRVEDGQDVIRWELAEAVPKVDSEDTYFDITPIHVMTTSTLRRLADLTPGTTFDHRRFRPNILLDTPNSEFVEQEWTGKTMWFDQLAMFILVPTPRCGMPTLAQEGLPVDREILRAIAKNNTLELDLLGSGRYACAGMNANPVTDGLLEVGRLMELKDSSPEIVALMNAPAS